MRAIPNSVASLTLGWTICTNRLLGDECAHGDACWFRHFTRIGPIKKNCMAAIRWKSNELKAKGASAIKRAKTDTTKKILDSTLAKEISASRPSACLYSELPATKQIGLDSVSTSVSTSPSPDSISTSVSTSPSPKISSAAITTVLTSALVIPHKPESATRGAASYHLLPIREKCAIYFMLKILIDGKHSTDDWREEYGIEFGLSFKFVRKYPEMFVMNETSGSIVPTDVALTCYRKVQSQFQSPL